MLSQGERHGVRLVSSVNLRQERFWQVRLPGLPSWADTKMRVNKSGAEWSGTKLAVTATQSVAVSTRQPAGLWAIGELSLSNSDVGTDEGAPSQNRPGHVHPEQLWQYIADQFLGKARAMHERDQLCLDPQTEFALLRESLGVSRINHILQVHGRTILQEKKAAETYDEIGQRSLERLFPGP